MEVFFVTLFRLMDLKSLGNNFRNELSADPETLTLDLEAPRYKHKAAKGYF